MASEASRRSITEVIDRGTYILERNVDVPLRTAGKGDVIRANVYRPKHITQCPVIVTYGPYGKDIPYSVFHPKSFSEVNETQKSVDSAWETPDPAFWTSQGYAVVRADERGCGQSPGLLDTMSSETADCFFDIVEWASEQPWSTGKVGLLGISYYAGSQWRVAALRPKGLKAMIPWEGMSDYYRDRVRHGGILSNTFIKRWWNRQVLSNQYGLPGRAARNWGPDTVDGDLSDDVLLRNRQDQTIDTGKYRFRDDKYFASKDFDLARIEVPLLSVGNWGGISLHLRGNVAGYMHAGSKFKYLRFITGRHDLPFYYQQEVELQLSFLNAFLRDSDSHGWTVPGKLPPVDLVLRKGSPGFNDAVAELKAFPRRTEMEWPISRTEYRKWHLTRSKTLDTSPDTSSDGVIFYSAPKGSVTFETSQFDQETEVTGHPVVRLSMSLGSENGSSPKEMDVFVTLRHIKSDGQEVFYTGTTGDPVPISKGWLRLSLRKTDPTHAQHRDYLPYRSYLSTDVQAPELDKVYTFDIEIWPTNVILSPGSKLTLEVAGSDTQGAGIFEHNDPEDRAEANLSGLNNIHIGQSWINYLQLPIIPRALPIDGNIDC